MNELFNLGNLYVSDFTKGNNAPRGGKESLCLVMDDIVGAPRLDIATDPDKMYGEYWYRSGINSTMTRELELVVRSSMSSISTNPGDIFLDLF